MISRASLPLVILLGCACVPLIADSGQQPNPQAVDLSALVQMMQQQQAAQPAKPDSSPFPPFNKVTEGMQSESGLFTLWHYPPDAKDKDREKLLAQVPVGFLGEQFMLSTSFSGGGFLTGFPLDERVVQWELLDRQLLLVEPETRYVVDRSKEVSDVVRRTYPDRIRVAVPLVTKAPNGDPVIDLGQLLKSNFADIAWTSFFSGGGRGSINPALSKWTKRKTFPLNVEINVELAVSRSSPPGSYDKKLVHYSFWKLPKTDYQPRVADDRIGYFLTVNQDWSKPAGERDIFNRYIDRWHLVKRDPSLKLCEPRQPIIFYIEKTVPVKYRRAVRDGILEWNKAFERIGFVNAIEVRQQTDDNEWKDLDPEDMRYSFFRWIVTGAGFAMGPHRRNPFTGQIYDADIIFDDAMVRFFEREAEHYLPEAVAMRKFQDPTLSEFIAAHPEWCRHAAPWKNVELGQTIQQEQQLRKHLRKRAGLTGLPLCDYMEGMKHQMALARTALAGQPQEVLDRFLYDVIKETVTHEVGHTLGLRHNFKASSIYSLDEIKQRRTTGEATCGSVMDYNPTLLFAQDATEGHFITPTIGPYDYWAIEYGYRPFDAAYRAEQAEQAQAAAEQQAAAQPIETQTTAVETKNGDVAVMMTKLPAGAEIKLEDLPAEIRAQLPDEIREMIASGAVSAGDEAPTPGATVAAPQFTGPPAGEAEMLQRIASRAAEPELVYATDEDTTFLSPDPLAYRFDMGSDPMAWATERIQLVDQRLADILDWAVKDHESWYHLRPAFLTLWFEKALVFDTVGRYIGGQYFARSHRGDPEAPPPFRLVEPAKQRAALRFIAERLYRDDFFHVPPRVLNHLAPSRWYHEGAFVTYALDFPLHDYVGMLQWWNLFDRLFPDMLRRIHDNELKTAAHDRLTVAEYLRTLQDACWSDVTDVQRLGAGDWSDNQPFVSSVRRSLQREYLGLVEPMVRRRPGGSLSPDLHALVRFSLKSLSADLGKILAASHADRLDFASHAHLDACKSRIDRILSAELSGQ